MSCITAAISQIFALCLTNQSTIDIINYCSEEHDIKTLQLLYLELLFFPSEYKARDSKIFMGFWGNGIAESIHKCKWTSNIICVSFSSGPGVKNLICNAGDTFDPWVRSVLHASEHLSLYTTTTESALWSPWAATTEAWMP